MMKVITLDKPKSDVTRFEQLNINDLFTRPFESGTWMRTSSVNEAVDLEDGYVGLFNGDEDVILLEGELSVWRKS